MILVKLKFLLSMGSMNLRSLNELICEVEYVSPQKFMDEAKEVSLPLLFTAH